MTKLPAYTSVTLVVPPVFSSDCLTRSLVTLTRGMHVTQHLPHSSQTVRLVPSLNFRADDEMTRDPSNFVDQIHYRSKIADGITAGVREALISAER